MSSAKIERAPWWSRFAEAWTGFWLAPTNPTPLHVVRIAAGLLFLAWLLPLASGYASLFGVDGWFDKAAYIEAHEKNLAAYPIGWSLIFPLTEAFGEGSFVTDTFFAVSIAVLILFTLGIATRLTAPLTWLVVVSHTANPALHYDGDDVFIVLAFYLMIGYVLLGLQTWKLSFLELIFGSSDTMLSPLRRADRVSHGAALALRLLQVHFALIVFVGAMHKLQFGTWWSGVALWYRMYPPQELSHEKLRDMKAMAWTSLGFISLAAYMVLAWQLAFPLFAFRRAWRPLLIGGAALGWLSSLLLTGVPYFGPLYLTFCLGYVSADEWAWLFGRLRPVPKSATTSAPQSAKIESRIRPHSKARS
jgi:hypothetical protein